MPRTAAEVYAELGATQAAIVDANIDVAAKREALASSEASLAGAERKGKIADAVAVATFTARPYFDDANGTLITVVDGKLTPSVPYRPGDEVAVVPVDIDGDGEPDNF